MGVNDTRLLLHAAGQLSKGWQGDVIYKSPLPCDVDQIQIDFSFSKREIIDDGNLEKQCRDAIAQNDPNLSLSVDQIQIFMERPKAELNLSVFVDGFCAGSAHYDALDKHVELSSDHASLGFVPCKIQGMLELQIKVFNVVQDETPYSLIVKGGQSDVYTS
ncbi:hypothetical protein QUW03_04205 [Faecalicoccus acidiformans]|uniref:DUF6669 family protein n=1 Tax=Faecalicoccus acidiformans TaxID=915173 RepID=UPI0025A3308A|nr:DUF6669 family protein [Faecalicoccus acidiformans]MDM8203572.1 hypothetical protein [Faecalicoccus acidiformans]